MKRFFTLLITICMVLTMAAPLAVSAAEESYWYDGATVTQKMGTITFNGSAATFSCDVPYAEGGSLGINKPISAPNKAVNVNFKLKIEGAWTTRESIIIYTGSHRAYIGFRANGISCQNKNGTGTLIPCAVGQTENSYSVQIDSNGIANFYFNGRSIMKDWQLPTNGGEAAISIGNYGGDRGTLSKFTISDVEWSVPETTTTTTVTSGDPPSLDVPPTPFFHEFTEEEDLSEWRCATDAVWIDTEKGVMAFDQAATSSTAAFYRVTFADEFILEHRLRFQEFADKFYYKVHYPGGVFSIDMRERKFHTETVSGDVLPMDFLLDPENPDEWHTMKFVSYGGKKYVKVYVDDQLIGDFATTPSTRAYYHLQIGAQGANGTHARMEYDWIRYTPVWAGDAALAAPLDGDEYLEGEPINLGVYLAEGVEADKVEYKVNGAVVATGTKENNYKATLTGLPAGSYSMTVSCNGTESTTTEFDVAPARKNSIQTSWSGGDKVTASLSYYDEMPSVKSVEYLVNGVSAGSSHQAPFTAPLKVSGTEGSTIVALCKDANGTVLEKLSASVAPDISGGKTTHYANEISYNVEGSGGNAVVDVSNGVFQMKMTHTPDSLTYLTNEGEKSVAAGAGQYKILTDGSFADVYYEGKLTASYRMPLTGSVTRTASENGMSVKNLNISIPEERQSYFAARNVTDKQTSYALPGLNDKYYYNVDFLASKEDNFKLVLNDSLFSVDLEFRDGKIYVQTAQSLDSEAYEYELCDALEGEAHYRLASELGMSNLYANGKVVGSFRDVRAVGEATLGVNITSGDGLSYLAVNDFKDIYLYEDNFSGGGTSDSNDYWETAYGMTNHIDTTRGEMLLIAKDKTNALAEMLAYAGTVEMGADVTVSQAGDGAGFWLMLSRPTNETYTKAGYNFETGEYEIIDRRETESSITKVTAPGDLAVGQTVRMEVKAEKQLKGGVSVDKKVTLYINGTPVLSKDSLDSDGKVGFMATNCSANIQNFSYRGDAKPMLDVRDGVVNGKTFPSSPTTSFYKSGDTIYSAQQTVGASTTDYGKTWSAVDMKALNYPKWGAHMLKLSSGEYLSLYKNSGVNAWGENYYNDAGQTLFQMQFWRSTDDGMGMEWEPAGLIYGEEPEYGEVGYGNTVGALAQSPDNANGTPGRVFFVGDNDLASEDYGDTKIWYSDDEGTTWTLADVITYEDQGNSSMQEPQPVATKDWVRVYYRNDRGMIRYFESTDNGTTWSHESKSTPFFAALNCFGMDTVRYYDENGEMHEDIYVAWSNDSQNMGARYQYTRTNTSLAKSEDYGASWEFLGTTRQNSTLNTDQMNLSLFMIDGYAFTNGYASSTSTKSTPQSAHPISTPVDKQVATMRIEQVKPRYTSYVEQFSAVRDSQVNRMLLVHGGTGAIMLRGMHIGNAATEDGVAATYAAAFIGATLEDNGSTVTLKSGDSAETFNVTEANGIKVIALEDLAERYGMKLVDLDGVKVLSPYGEWTWRGTDAIRNALNLF